MQKKFILIFFYILTIFHAFAGGKKEIIEREADNLDSWEEVFDISEKTTGKYNIMVTASDEGGNTSIAGPYNIYIDPESDLPVTNITNPLFDQGVPGNLNVVGTCIDDDGVSHVEIVFDGDTENPQQAEGTEFWSYYLDTTKLSEGPHTIDVYGYDINDTVGHSSSVTWHLNRKVPQTTIDSLSIGQLVSGKVHLQGTVSDGNDISKLWSSIDNGETFQPLKIKFDAETKSWKFDLQLNTTKMEDGPKVCWFKGLDEQGSYGVYSFLFYIDNTAPELQFLYPSAETAVNGEFAIAGSVKDLVSIQSLEWHIGNDSGVFELVPGNPYWAAIFDASLYGGKKCDISVIATDTVGNQTTVKRTIPFDFEADKPTLVIESPLPNDTIYDSFFFQGTVFDDDGVASLVYVLDDGLEHVITTDKVFSTKITPSETILPNGQHTLFVYAIDSNGQKGNIIEIPLISQGEKPVFSDVLISSNKKDADKTKYTEGMTVNPESNSVVKAFVDASCGIKEVYWQFKGSESVPITIKKPTEKIALEIPFEKSPWGVSELTIHAIDVYNRETIKTLLFNVLDLTKINTDPKVIFSDSTITDNFIDFTKNPIVSGFFTGGTAASVELAPSTDYVKVALKDNSIILSPGTEKGTSDSFVVRITTDKDLQYDSIKLKAKTPSSVPILSLANSQVYDGYNKVVINGTVKSETEIKSTKYRLLTAHTINTDKTREKTSAADTAFKSILLDEETGSFSIEYKPNEVPEGVSIVEVITETIEGNTAVEAAFIQRIPEMPEPEEGEKAKAPTKPLFDWIEGENIYYTCIYQGDYTVGDILLDKQSLVTKSFAQGGVIDTEDLHVGLNALSVSVLYGENKSAKTTYKYTKTGESIIRITSVDDQDYYSGMKVVLPAKTSKDSPHSIYATLTSPNKISKATATINGVSVSAKILKTDTLNTYTIKVPLEEVPAGINNVAILINIGKEDSLSVNGSFSVLRSAPLAGIENKEKIYWIETAYSTLNNGSLLLNKGEELIGYANLAGPVKVRLEPEIAGLNAYVVDKTVFVKANVDGIYNNINLIATDRDGFEYKTSVWDFILDSEKPLLTVENPINGSWIQNSVDFLLSATDLNGISEVLVSVNNGKTWIKTDKLEEETSLQYVARVDITNASEGVVPIKIKATDMAGREQVQQLVLVKDTTPPTASVIVPPEGESINGQTTIVLKLTDDGKIVRTQSFVTDSSEPADLNFAPVIKTKIGTESRELSENMEFKFTDAAGNVGLLNNYDFIINKNEDKPQVEIHIPDADAVITSDFVVSGVIYDDDGPCKVWYALDNDNLEDTSNFIALSGYMNSYSIDIPLSSLTDNEHWITIFAEDIYGVKGDPQFVPFKVSLAEPRAEVRQPIVGKTVQGLTTLTGVSSDKNGVKKIQISLDNGNSFNDAVGTENWSYTFNTNLLEDGTHVFFVRVYDNYGIAGLYSSLINIDNTNPDLELDLPLDGSVTTGNLFFSGQTMDNIDLSSLIVSINSIGDNRNAVPSNLSRIELVPDDIITQVVDISDLEDGFYNIELAGADAAGNVTRISRNIQLDTSKVATIANLMYPMNGEQVQGLFNIYGNTESEIPISRVMLYIDGEMTMDTELSSSNYFKFELGPEELSSGAHTAQVRVITETGSFVDSNIQIFYYTATGPWISIDNFCMGDFAYGRPFLEGATGYALSKRDVVILENKDASKEEKAEVSLKSVEKVELSFDNGKTFEKVGTNEKWRYQIENEDMAAGFYFIILRSTMKNGEIATTRTIVQIDKTAPSIKLVSPSEGGRYNQELHFAGLSTDDIKLESVHLALRSGDKSSYSVPSFIQGLYIDAHFFGATLFDVGLGLTFFDDNVKLQAQYGQMTENQYEMLTGSTEELRYGGNVFGGKLIANLGYVPFRYFFGPDWEWLSATFGLGANFSYFSDTQSDRGQILSAVVGQIEFPRITIPDQDILSTFSLYTEGQLWFIPTDVSSSEVDIDSIIPQISCGLRINIF